MVVGFDIIFFCFLDLLIRMCDGLCLECNDSILFSFTLLLLGEQGETGGGGDDDDRDLLLFSLSTTTVDCRRGLV